MSQDIPYRHRVDLDFNQFRPLCQDATAFQQLCQILIQYDAAQQRHWLHQVSTLLATQPLTEGLEMVLEYIGQWLKADRVSVFTVLKDTIRLVGEWKVEPNIPALSILPEVVQNLPQLVHLCTRMEEFPGFYTDNYGALVRTSVEEMFWHWLSPQVLASIELKFQGQRLGGLIVERLQVHADSTAADPQPFSSNQLLLIEQVAQPMAAACYKAHIHDYTEVIVAQRTQQVEQQKRDSEAASRAKSQFLAMMSHELRTPLNSILGLSNLLSQEVIGPLNDKQREYLDCIHESGEHLLALISDILDLSRLEAGREQLTFTTIDLNELCQGLFGYGAVSGPGKRVGIKPST
jgi:signal transduction histidine kinase